jgi:hypothetical protein
MLVAVCTAAKIDFAYSYDENLSNAGEKTVFCTLHLTAQ